MLPIQTLHRHSDSVNTMVINGDLMLSGAEDTEIKVCCRCCMYSAVCRTLPFRLQSIGRLLGIR